MRTTLRQAREQTGITMSEMAERLGVSVPSVSTLERNDEQGRAKTATVDRALAALRLVRWDVVLPAEEFDAILLRAEEIAAEVSWTMSLEAQTLTDDAVSKIVQRLVARSVAGCIEECCPSTEWVDSSGD
jgi:transcriptional regulator with XRE-family HTH domain